MGRKLALLILIFSNLSANSFIIKDKKNISKNQIKEEIGECIKSTIDDSARVIQLVGGKLKGSDKAGAFGDVLTIIGEVQITLSSKAQMLLENASPFKNASRNQLREARDTLSEIDMELQHQLQSNNIELSKFKDMQNKICACNCLR